MEEKKPRTRENHLYRCFESPYKSMTAIWKNKGTVSFGKEKKLMQTNSLTQEKLERRK